MEPNSGLAEGRVRRSAHSGALLRGATGAPDNFVETSKRCQTAELLGTSYHEKRDPEYGERKDRNADGVCYKDRRRVEADFDRSNPPRRHVQSQPTSPFADRRAGSPPVHVWRRAVHTLQQLPGDAGRFELPEAHALAPRKREAGTSHRRAEAADPELGAVAGKRRGMGRIPEETSAVRKRASGRRERNFAVQRAAAEDDSGAERQDEKRVQLFERGSVDAPQQPSSEEETAGFYRKTRFYRWSVGVGGRCARLRCKETLSLNRRNRKAIVAGKSGQFARHTDGGELVKPGVSAQKTPAIKQ